MLAGLDNDLRAIGGLDVVDAGTAEDEAGGDDDDAPHAGRHPHQRAFADKIVAEAFHGRIRYDMAIIDLRIDELDFAIFGTKDNYLGMSKIMINLYYKSQETSYPVTRILKTVRLISGI